MFAAFHLYSAAYLSAAGYASHGNPNGSYRFMPRNSSTNSGGIASESTPVGNLTGALWRCLDRAS
jgi:hypothetical protein